MFLLSSLAAFLRAYLLLGRSSNLCDEPVSLQMRPSPCPSRVRRSTALTRTFQTYPSNMINAQGAIFWQAAQSEVMIQGKRRLLAAIERSQPRRSDAVPAIDAGAAGKRQCVFEFRRGSACRYGFTRSGCAAWKAGSSAHLLSMSMIRLKAVNSTPQRRAL